MVVCVDLMLDLRGFFCFGWGVFVWCCVLGFCDIVSLFSSSHVFVITLCFILSGLFWCFGVLFVFDGVDLVCLLL